MNHLLKNIEVKVRFSEKKKDQTATIALDFGDFILKGFRVQNSKFVNSRGDKLWLTPPVYAAHGRFIPIFYMPDKKLWEKLSKIIWDEYYNQLSFKRAQDGEQQWV
ncbi:MAG: hypothetical protein A3A83_02115 [Candidatus Doudnabacteria bacterium RIFCSPLOWO2_01_FULL_48_57]|nr:MAG: hypothetical protein A3A83_02115 [Candidatus Doudnabacteria bacterium RIFCSPLOWO2_01_FULL_48_57]